MMLASACHERRAKTCAAPARPQVPTVKAHVQCPVSDLWTNGEFHSLISSVKVEQVNKSPM